jgi:cytochrome c
MMVALLLQPSGNSDHTAPTLKRPLVITQQVKLGQALASQHCATCHAIGRTGRSPNPAAPKFRHLAQKYPVESLSEAFAEGVFIGHSVMPEFQFAPDEVRGLIAYLKAIQVSDRVPRKKPASN